MSEIDTSQTSSEKTGVEAATPPKEWRNWRNGVKEACFRVIDDKSATHTDLLHAADCLLMLYGYGSRTSAGVRHTRTVAARVKRAEAKAASTVHTLKEEAKTRVTARERLHNILTVETDAEV